MLIVNTESNYCDCELKWDVTNQNKVKGKAE